MQYKLLLFKYISEIKWLENVSPVGVCPPARITPGNGTLHQQWMIPDQNTSNSITLEVQSPTESTISKVIKQAVTIIATADRLDRVKGHTCANSLYSLEN